LLGCQTKIPEASIHADHAALLMAGANSQTLGEYPGPASLKGLKGVAVKVYADRSIPAGRIAPGPFDEEIRKKTVEKLKSAGIEVMDESQAEAVLHVDMYMVCQADGPGCGFHTAIELKQRVGLMRDPRISLDAITWRNSYTNGIVEKEVNCCVADLLAADSEALVLGFIQDYRTANPR